MWLSEGQVNSFHTRGWLVISPFAPDEIHELALMVDEVQSWDDLGSWIHHREMTDHGPRLCRTENFVPFHAGLRALLTEGVLPGAAAELLGEDVFLYKEKINYKLAGGAGFRPHQDAPAYPFIGRSISVMVAVDRSTVENGCLEVVDAMHAGIIPTDDGGCITSDWTDSHSWHPVPMEAGDVLFFDALTPHRSGPNLSGMDRRALFPTYNASAEGNLREAYYAEKARVFTDTEHRGDNVRISLINDFEGRPVT